MSQNKTDNIRVNAPKHIDAWRYKEDGTPYISKDEAHFTIPSGYKFVGRECVILKNGVPTEYWYKTAITNATDLIEKQDGLSSVNANDYFDDGGTAKTAIAYRSADNVISGLHDPYTKEPASYIKITTYIDGTAMDDTKLNVIYRKKGTEYFKRIYTIIDARWFGVIADGARLGSGAFVGTDNTANFQKALSFISQSKIRTTLRVSEGSYRCLGTLSMDIKYTSIDGAGAKILYDGNSICLRVYGTQYPPFDQAINRTVAIQLQGKANDVYYTAGDSNASVGIYFHSLGGDTSGGTHHVFSNLVVNNFGKLLHYGDDAYNILISNSQLGYGTVCIQADQGTNNGERLSFDNVSIFNSPLAVRAANTNCDMFFQNCSFDYNVKQIEVLGGRVFCNMCHFENNRVDSIVTNFTVNGNGSILQITDSEILQDYTASPTINHIFQADIYTYLRVKDCFIAGMGTITGEMATGAGSIEISGITSYHQSNNALITAVENNVLTDGGFEATTVLDKFYILNDTVAVTNDLVGTNIVLSTSTDTFRTGTRSFRAVKQFGPGSNSGFALMIPIRHLQRPAFRLWVKSATTENKFITHGYTVLARNSGNAPFMGRIQEMGAITVTNIANWTKVNSSDPIIPCPAWATHYYVYFNLFEMSGTNNGTGLFYIDDFLVTYM